MSLEISTEQKLFEWILLTSTDFSRKMRFNKEKAFAKNKASLKQDVSITENNFH